MRAKTRPLPNERALSLPSSGRTTADHLARFVTTCGAVACPDVKPLDRFNTYPRPSPSGMFSFRPLALQDLSMVQAWLQRPHVAQWWPEPTSLVELERDYLPGTMNESSTRAYIAMLDGEPIGFIQSYVAMGSGEGWWEQETDPGTRGIDQFLANAEQLGRGLGSSMICAFVERLFQDPAVTKVQTDPSPKNERAIRCYRRAGFVVQGEITTPDGSALLMLRHRNNPASPAQATA